MSVGQPKHQQIPETSRSFSRYLPPFWKFASKHLVLREVWKELPLRKQIEAIKSLNHSKVWIFLFFQIIEKNNTWWLRLDSHNFKSCLFISTKEDYLSVFSAAHFFQQKLRNKHETSQAQSSYPNLKASQEHFDRELFPSFSSVFFDFHELCVQMLWNPKVQQSVGFQKLKLLIESFLEARVFLKDHHNLSRCDELFADLKGSVSNIEGVVIDDFVKSCDNAAFEVWIECFLLIESVIGGGNEFDAKMNWKKKSNELMSGLSKNSSSHLWQQFKNNLLADELHLIDNMHCRFINEDRELLFNQLFNWLHWRLFLVRLHEIEHSAQVNCPKYETVDQKNCEQKPWKRFSRQFVRRSTKNSDQQFHDGNFDFRTNHKVL